MAIHSLLCLSVKCSSCRLAGKAHSRGYIPNVPLEPLKTGGTALNPADSSGPDRSGFYGYRKREIYGILLTGYKNGLPFAESIFDAASVIQLRRGYIVYIVDYTPGRSMISVHSFLSRSSSGTNSVVIAVQALGWNSHFS